MPCRRWDFALRHPVSLGLAPGSQRASAEQLDLHHGRTHALNSVYLLMDALHERLDVLKQIVLQATASPTGGSVQMMLFDVTTLYFESVQADELRAFGYAKDDDRVAAGAAWDGLHAIVTNDRTSSASQLLAQYRRLWVIEESFRTLKRGLALRPIHRFKPERIQAHIALCCLAFALSRHAQQRIKLAQQAMSMERIRAALHGVQASTAAVQLDTSAMARTRSGARWATLASSSAVIWPTGSGRLM